MGNSVKNQDTKAKHSSAATLEIVYGKPLRPIFSYKSAAGFTLRTIPTASSMLAPDAIKIPRSSFPLLLGTVVADPWREIKLSITFGDLPLHIACVSVPYFSERDNKKNSPNVIESLLSLYGAATTAPIRNVKLLIGLLIASGASWAEGTHDPETIWMSLGGHPNWVPTAPS